MIFVDTAQTANVFISGTVSPGSVVFDNSALSYDVSGGSISGSEGIVKTGTGMLTFTNVNGYSGGTTVSEGTVALGANGTTSATLGAGPVSLAEATTLSMADPNGDNYPTNSVTILPGASATFASISAIDVFGGSISGTSNVTITLSGPVSFGLSGTAQFGGLYGLAYIPTGSQLKFSSTGGANGNGGANTTFLVDGLVNTRNATGTGGVVLGALSGYGQIQGQTNTAAGNDTYFVGAKNIDSTFSGTIANGANGTTSLTKIGSGTLTLSGSNSYTGATSVTAGILEITGTIAGTSGVAVSPGAMLELEGGTLLVSGGITNAGIFKLAGTPVLSYAGTFTNTGILDLIDGPGALPARFINSGTVLDSSSVQVQQAVISGNNFSLTIEGYTGHTYQLQSTSSLSPSNWQNVGAMQAGHGSTLTFTDSGGAAGSSQFYRIVVSP